MKLLKKATTLFLALGMTAGMTAGFAACGGDKGGDNNSVDTGAAKGEQVTLAEWATAVTNTLTVDNVTINTFEDMHMEEVWDDGEHMVYEGTTNGVIKLAKNILYKKSSGTGTVNGVSATEFSERYEYVEENMYYRWSRESADSEWEYRETPYFAGMFDGTAGEIVFGEMDAQFLIALYDSLEYDESTGEYSVLIEDEYDPFVLKCKIVDDKFYTVTKRFEDTAETSPSEFGYIEYKHVFVDYGTTSVRLPNEEEEEDSGKDESSEEGKTSSSVSVWQPAAMTEEEWKAAFDATFSASNLLINGNVTMVAMGVNASGTEKVAFEGDKLYWEQNTTTGVYKGYLGVAYDASCGYEVPYEWNWNSDTSSWDCEYAEGGLVDIEDVFMCLTCETYIDALYYAHDNAVYNSEKGCYVIDLAPWLSELMSGSTVTGTLEITFANGLVSKIKGASEDEPFEGFTVIEEYEYVFTYGNASVGELPAVTV